MRLTGLIAATAVLLAAGLAWVARHRIAVVAVDGSSMEPTLTAGDRVLVRRAAAGAVRTGEVVVLEQPGPDGAWTTRPARWPVGEREWMIKRVAAVPGDVVPAAIRRHRTVTEHIVPDGRLLVLGDNAEASRDSRHLGYIPAERILAVMVRPLAPRQRPLAVRQAAGNASGGRSSADAL